jgi:AbrB family looped-hinge helix DNA binding protein
MTAIEVVQSKSQTERPGYHPLELRSKLGIEEGSILEIKAEDGEIVLKALPPIEPGEPVGEEEFRKILAELEERRRNWR